MTRTITEYDPEINSSELLDRMEELRAKQETAVIVEVFRIRRPDEILFTASSQTAADQFIDREDFNPERVKTRTRPGTFKEREELRLLERTDKYGRDAFGSKAWQEGVTLLRYDNPTLPPAPESYAAITRRIAEALVVDLSRVQRALQPDAYPLNLITFKNVRDGYMTVDVEGFDYYGKKA